MHTHEDVRKKQENQFFYLTQPSLVQVPYPESIEEYLRLVNLGLALFIVQEYMYIA